MELVRSGVEEGILFQNHTSVPEESRRTLQSIHGTLAHELTVQLSAYLRAAVSVKFAGMEECTFAQFVDEREACSCAGWIKLSPLNSKLILDVAPSILFSFVEVMLGGKLTARLVPDRAATEIEKQLLTLVMNSMTVELERAWNTVARISLQFVGVEADPQVAKLLSPSESVVLAKFEVTVGEHTGTFVVLTPSHNAEALIEGPGLSDSAETIEQHRISHAVLESSITFDVWLDGVSLPLRDLVHLREGHVIKFDHPTDLDLQSTINGVSGFAGQVVSTGRKRAFQIQPSTAG